MQQIMLMKNFAMAGLVALYLNAVSRARSQP
jgi:hypothetical protein